MTNPTTSTTAREARIAEDTVGAIDVFSRLLGAVETGRWHYAADKSRQLTKKLDALSVTLARTDQAASRQIVEAIVRRDSQPYRIGQALYGDRAAAAEPSPLEQVEAAKRRRDFAGEIQAARAGQQALESAPWYPARPGDLLHVHYEASGEFEAYGETYIVEYSEAQGGQVLRLLCDTAGVDGYAGAFAPGMVDDPFTEAWYEAGPQRLTIVRHGRVVHGQGADVR